MLLYLHLLLGVQQDLRKGRQLCVQGYQLTLRPLAADHALVVLCGRWLMREVLSATFPICSDHMVICVNVLLRRLLKGAVVVEVMVIIIIYDCWRPLSLIILILGLRQFISVFVYYLRDTLHWLISLIERSRYFNL